MKHRTIERFWKCYWNLPDEIRRLADKNFAIMRENPAHPSLHFKKIGKLWSARVGLGHRALAIEDGEDFIWVWIGTHDEYDDLITR